MPESDARNVGKGKVRKWGGWGESGYVGWGGDGSTLRQLTTLTSSHTLDNSSLRVGMPGGMLGGLGGGGSVNRCAWRGRRGMKNGGGGDR